MNRADVTGHVPDYLSESIAGALSLLPSHGNAVLFTFATAQAPGSDRAAALARRVTSLTENVTRDLYGIHPCLGSNTGEGFWIGDDILCVPVTMAPAGTVHRLATSSDWVRAHVVSLCPISAGQPAGLFYPSKG